MFAAMYIMFQKFVKYYTFSDYICLSSTSRKNEAKIMIAILSPAP